MQIALVFVSFYALSNFELLFLFTVGCIYENPQNSVQHSCQHPPAASKIYFQE
jgi:hypothetical protein